MGTFLLLLLLFFIVIPLCQVLWRLWQVRSQYKAMRRQMEDAFRGAGSRQDARGGKRPSARPRKKIDPDDGEYVEFEEIKCETAEVHVSGTEVRAENQVEDAEWEEIK